MSHSHTIIIHTPLSLNVPSEYKTGNKMQMSQCPSVPVFMHFPFFSADNENL
jgi:hypothetical protein